MKNNDDSGNVGSVMLGTDRDNFRMNLAIGTLTFYASVLFLFILNSAIYYNYHPDISAILDKIAPLSIAPRSWFAPEPVERLQFVLSAFLIPFIIVGSFTLISKKKPFFYDNPRLCRVINISGLVILVFYMINMLAESLLHIPNETNIYFFKKNMVSVLNPFIAIVLFLIITIGFYLYEKINGGTTKKVITLTVVYGTVGLLILDMVLYNVFQLANLDIDVSGETNAVFYSITQVYAGKSLLVNTNCQYGLYAWMLLPIFKIIGLSAYKIGLVMGILNGISYFLLFLGIKKVIKHDVLSLFTFLTLIFWNYWQTRIPFGSEPRFYYQYWPLRILFPSIAFYLFSVYTETTEKRKRVLRPILSITSSLAVLWNFDTGIVVYIATMAAIFMLSIDFLSFKNTLKRFFSDILWMTCSLIFLLLAFTLFTKIHSGFWPDLQKLMAYQHIFYISGFFMLPMSAIHFWNAPVIVYLTAGIYAMYLVKKMDNKDAAMLVFLFILGIGLFAYFQGRSYDLSINAVMYPAIIITGIFCYKLYLYIRNSKSRLNESAIFFLFLFIFLVDSASSMIYYTPTIHAFSLDNATHTDNEKEEKLALRTNFIKNNIRERDTVLIIAKNYESYYYASGRYYNPLNLPGSTEIFFTSEIDTLLNLIKTTKYPIIVDARYYWPNADTIIRTLAKYTTIEKTLPSDYTFVLLKPGKLPSKSRLGIEPGSLYYSNLGEFDKYLNPSSQLSLPASFTLEFFGRLDSNQVMKDNIMFCTLTQNNPFSGLLMKQEGDDLTNYVFMYGDGSHWCKASPIKLNFTSDSHVLIKVEKNIIVTYNNSTLYGEVNTNSIVKNNDGIFYINPSFAGTISEIEISKK